MTWFAQNGEDRKLEFMLGEKNDGFYIDVGAWDPSIHSVTKHFYDKGWRGINVEPVAIYHELLERERPCDINVRAACGDLNGYRDFHVVHDSGLSTFDAGNARAAVRREGFDVDVVRVTVLTLADICENYVPREATLEAYSGVGPRIGGNARDCPHIAIDFLKIDVEGWERQVVAGADWERFRPKILCIEATQPMTEIPTHDAWEPLLEQAGYSFIVFDGLNRFYQDGRL